tara:strand:+ start:847 stop:1077 length:231 start_codon:yes stop_codon:yes gene_type:complete
MDQQTVIADLEARADAAGVSIRQVCVRAGVHPTTFSRWKLSDRNADPIGATLHSIGKIDAALREFENAASAPPEAA